MRTDWRHLERYRIKIHQFQYDSETGDHFGAFVIPRGKTGVSLRVIASSPDEEVQWEHVSVSLENRCPTWEEMSFIKSLFWDPTETVIQFHVPDAEHINFHKFCLHLWRPTGFDIPRPPGWTIA